MNADLRAAVLLVAGHLPNLAEVDRTNGVDLSDVEALGWDFYKLWEAVLRFNMKERGEVGDEQD